MDRDTNVAVVRDSWNACWDLQEWFATISDGCIDLTLARTLLDSWIGRGSASGVGAVLVLALFGGCAWSPDITVRNEKDEPPIIDRSLVKPSPDSPDQPFLLHGLQSFTVEGAVTDPDDPVGLASYGVDDWPYAMHPFEGKVALQGGDYSMLYLDEVHRGIYKIPYRAITPDERECANLLVPVCCSASHIAMTSIRMEPVWMSLGEAVGIAAAMAIRLECPLQRVDYTKLRSRLLEVGARLERPSTDRSNP